MKFRRLCRYCALTMAIAFAITLTAAMVRAAPLVAHPGGTHAAGFAVHLAPAGPAPLSSPGPPVGPIAFVDPLGNPGGAHHFEIELHNPAVVPASFNVAMTFPGGGVPLTGIALPPGGSVYWDIHYSDIPPEIGAYSFFAVNPDVDSPDLLFTASVIEYPAPAGGPPLGAGAPTFFGPPGGVVLGAPLLGVDPVFILVIPEPSTTVLATIGLVAVVLIGRRRAATG